MICILIKFMLSLNVHKKFKEKNQNEKIDLFLNRY